MKVLVKAKEQYASLNKKVVLLIAFTIAISIFLFYPIFFNADIGETIGNMIESGFAWVVRVVGDGIQTIVSGFGKNMDELVFNVKGGFKDGSTLGDMNLTLLKGKVLGNNLLKLYDLFLTMAIGILVAYSSLITIDFIKAGDDSRYKSMLKSRLIRLCVTIVLLVSLPSIMDLLFSINQALLDTFRLFINATLQEVPSVNEPFLMDTFKSLSKENGSLVLAFVYVVSGFLNVWMIIFYMIRDLTISFLYILAPIIVVLLPYRIDLVKNWAKEMASNIFTQSIHAIVITICLSMVNGLSSSDTSNLYDEIFCLVTFAMFIPITGIVKRALGLEGEIGAAKSSAGLGGAIGAISLAGLTTNGIMGKYHSVKGAVDDLKNVNSEITAAHKSDFSASADNNVSNYSANSRVASNQEISPGQVPPSNIGTRYAQFSGLPHQDYDDNTYSASTKMNELKGMRSQARRKILKEIGGGVFGTIGATTMAIGSSAYGSPMGTMMAARMGADTGNFAGEFVGTGADKVGSFASEKVQDMAYGKNIRYDGEQRATLKSLTDGIENGNSLGDKARIIKQNYDSNIERIKNTKDDVANVENSYANGTLEIPDGLTYEQYSKEKIALNKRDSLERRGEFDKARRSYVKNTYDRNNTDESPIDIKVGDSPDVMYHQGPNVSTDNLLSEGNDSNEEINLNHPSSPPEPYSYDPNASNVVLDKDGVNMRARSNTVTGKRNVQVNGNSSNIPLNNINSSIDSQVESMMNDMMAENGISNQELTTTVMASGNIGNSFEIQGASSSDISIDNFGNDDMVSQMMNDMQFEVSSIDTGNVSSINTVQGNISSNINLQGGTDRKVSIDEGLQNQYEQTSEYINNLRRLQEFSDDAYFGSDIGQI